MFGLTKLDVDMYFKIEAAGLTVRQAFEMKLAGTLSKELSDALDEYEILLEEQRKCKSK